MSCKNCKCDECLEMARIEAREKEFTSLGVPYCASYKHEGPCYCNMGRWERGEATVMCNNPRVEKKLPAPKTRNP